jgi:CBS domain containing-hemolysin-like protein
MNIVFGVADTHWALDLLGVLAIPALVALNAFFVVAEFSLVSIRKTRVEEMVKNGVRRAKSVQDAITHLDRSIAATQLGITLASLALGWVGEPALARVIQPWFGFMPFLMGGITAHGAAIVVTFSLITFMHVVLGEQFPKSVALQAADRTSLLVATPLNIFARATRPLVGTMNFFCNRLLAAFGFRRSSGEESVHSVEELLLVIEDTEEAGILNPLQADLVENVFRLSNKKVADCMVPRERMAGLELSSSPEQVLEKVREGAHTRMPVYEGTMDNVVGIVNTKNLFHLYSLRGVAILDDALYPATFLSPDDSISTALQRLRKSRRPMALVRDKENKILGLVTLEDLVEEIVGDIEDEHDRPTPRLILRRTKKR